MSEIKQAASQTVAEIASNPKTGLVVGGASGFLSSIDPSMVLTILSIVLVLFSLANQLTITVKNIKKWRDRRKAAKDDRSND